MLLLSCLKSWCQSNSPTGGQTDSITIPISYIRLANQKLIENKYNKQIIVQQDSLIALHKDKYHALQVETSILQTKLYDSYQTNKNLENSLQRSNNKCKFLGGIAATGIIAFVVCALVK